MFENEWQDEDTFDIVRKNAFQIGYKFDYPDQSNPKDDVVPTATMKIYKLVRFSKMTEEDKKAFQDKTEVENYEKVSNANAILYKTCFIYGIQLNALTMFRLWTRG